MLVLNPLLAVLLLAPSNAFIPRVNAVAPLTKDALQQHTTALLPDAPWASQLDGVHLLVENDLDSKTVKHRVMLLSRPRNYKDGMNACMKLGEKGYEVDGSYNIGKALTNTLVAPSETKSASYFWVGNSKPFNDQKSCVAIQKSTGKPLQQPCSTRLPTLCQNTLPRTIFNQANISQQIRVDTLGAGTFQGYRDANQFRFLGIPYAEPPVGDLRFAGPRRLKAQRAGAAAMEVGAGVRDATRFGNVCWQTVVGNNRVSIGQDFLQAKESEDCLYLNVFTPSLKSRRVKGLPVMFYIHGGSYTSNAGSLPVFEPGNVVSRGGVVVVTMNYRLGVFGLFENAPSIARSAAPGNLPTRDQIAALQWVKDNIQAFGGDPDQVTIFGESAGAYSIRALLSAPSAFGMYKNAISQSDLIGVPFAGPDFASAVLGNNTMTALGCRPSDLSCARQKSVQEIHAAEAKALQLFLNDPQYTVNYAWVPLPTIYRPCADGDLIPADFSELTKYGRFNTKANIMWGSTRDEIGSFIPLFYPNPIPMQNMDRALRTLIREPKTREIMNSPYYRLNQSDPDTVRNQVQHAFTDAYFVCGTQAMSRNAIKHSKNIYTYRFNHGRSITRMLQIPGSPFCDDKVCHTDDIVPNFASADALPNVDQTGNDARFARQIVDRFTTFARTGNPNPQPGQLGLAAQNPDLTKVQWPRYNAQNPILEFELAKSTVSNNVDNARCDWIQSYIGYEYENHPPKIA